DAPGGRSLLNARGDVHAVAVDPTALHDDVAEIDPDAKLQPPIRGQGGVVPLQLPLNVNRTPDRGGHAVELGEEAVAGRVDDPAVVLGDHPDHHDPIGREGPHGRFDIAGDEAAVASDVGVKTRGEPPFHDTPLSPIAVSTI